MQKTSNCITLSNASLLEYPKCKHQHMWRDFCTYPRIDVAAHRNYGKTMEKTGNYGDQCCANSGKSIPGKTGKFLKEKCLLDSKLIWPIFYVRFIDDGFEITKGSWKDVEHWIPEFNKLVKSITIDKYRYGMKVAFMDLSIFKGST